MTTVKWYLSSSGSSLILLNLSEANKVPHLDSGFVDNTARIGRTPFRDEIVASKFYNKNLTL